MKDEFPIFSLETGLDCNGNWTDTFFYAIRLIFIMDSYNEFVFNWKKSLSGLCESRHGGVAKCLYW